MIKRVKPATNRLFAAIVGLGIAFAVCAQKPPSASKPAAPQPTPMDARVAYCRPVVASTVEMHATTLAMNLPASQHSIVAAQHAAAIERTRRLELHFLPRITAVEPAVLLDAQARGRDDAASVRKLLAPCHAKCAAAANLQDSSSCFKQCAGDSEAAKRARDCDDISWLPLQEGQRP